MDYIVLEGVKPYDGRYEFDLDLDFTTREWGWIKRLSGYMPLTIGPGLDGRDPELFAVFAAIAMVRAGKIEKQEVPEVFERLSDAPFGTTVQFEGEPVEEEDEASPPPTSSNGSPVSSGLVSPTSSGISGSSPSAPGSPPSATSESSPTTSGR